MPFETARIESKEFTNNPTYLLLLSLVAHLSLCACHARVARPNSVMSSRVARAPFLSKFFLASGFWGFQFTLVHHGFPSQRSSFFNCLVSTYEISSNTLLKLYLVHSHRYVELFHRFLQLTNSLKIGLISPKQSFPQGFLKFGICPARTARIVQ